jgi:predicted DNA-binding protein with PD1-like motif
MTGADKTVVEEGRFGRVITARIRPNVDLVEGIEQICTELGIVRAEVRSAIGSLTDAVLLAGTSKKLVEGAGLEIALASGHVGPDVDGQLRARLFGLVSDGDGRPHAGEFARGENPVFVTLELVLQEWIPDGPVELILGERHG